jgi:hypothetical protein
MTVLNLPVDPIRPLPIARLPPAVARSPRLTPITEASNESDGRPSLEVEEGETESREAAKDSSENSKEDKEHDSESNFQGKQSSMKTYQGSDA